MDVWQIAIDIQFQIQSVMWSFQNISKLSRDVLKNKNKNKNVNWHVHLILEWHLTVNISKKQKWNLLKLLSTASQFNF